MSRGRAAELKAESKPGSRKDKAAEAEAELLVKIAAIPEPTEKAWKELEALVERGARGQRT